MGNNLSWIKNPSTNPNPKKLCPDEELLRVKYIEEKKSSHKIAKEMNVTQRLVIIWLRRANIRTRTYAESCKLTLNGYKDGELHPNWVGDKVSYPALHTWVRNHKGTPQKCEKCGTTDPHRYEWASIGHKYLRDLNNWIRLCPSCHRKIDCQNRLKII